MSEEYPYKYDVVMKMKIGAKEDLSEKTIMNSVKIALWGIEITTLKDVRIVDCSIEGEKRQEDKDVSI